MLHAICRLCWARLPLPLPLKRKAKDFLFRRLPWLFHGLPAFRRWRLFQPDLHRARGAQPGAAAAVDGPTARTVRAIAMYLPQFHRIPENDAWWGEGFTEWTNVRRGRPMYAGHHQPAVPHADVGYYDLADESVLERQAEMARAHGIHGFCFYYYWFSGRRLLEKPLERMLRTGKPEFPFCICWANENWTRNWDGLDREVLIASRESADDDEHFIRDLIPLLRDPRYIRVEGRPIILVYRVDALADPRRTAATWRRICREAGIGAIHLCSVWSFDTADPRGAGFDSAVQFPPLMVPCANLAADPGAGIRTVPGFAGAVLDYREAVRAGLGDLSAGFPTFRGVMPAWDNTPRRMERGVSWIHSSPEAYGDWLRAAVARTCADQPPERRLVFINAWNEWAEGAYLEPDERSGYRRLEATRAALLGGGPAILSRSSAVDARLRDADRNVLFDLLFCQPGFHGGGEYGKAVFRGLVDRAAADGGVRVWATFDPTVFIEPWVTDLCRDAGVAVVPVTSFADVAALVESDRFAAFFTPGLVSYSGLFGSPRGSPPCDGAAARGRRTRITGAVHDILEVTLARRRSPWARSQEGRAVVGRRTRHDYARLFSCDRIETIVTVSEHSRDEILESFGPPAADLVVLTPPATHHPAPEPFTIDGVDPGGLDFALLVNAGRPEKNAALAVRVFDELFSGPDAGAIPGDFRVVVGGVDTIDDLGLRGLRHRRRFSAVPHLPARHFEYLLRAARFLVYPSFEEGFGYPPVEALRHGTPSVVSRTGAVREVCGDAAIYCDPEDPGSLRQAILEMLQQPIPANVLGRRAADLAARQREGLTRLIDLILRDPAGNAGPRTTVAPIVRVGGGAA